MKKARTARIVPQDDDDVVESQTIVLGSSDEEDTQGVFGHQCPWTVAKRVKSRKRRSTTASTLQSKESKQALESSSNKRRKSWRTKEADHTVLDLKKLEESEAEKDPGASASTSKKAGTLEKKLTPRSRKQKNKTSNSAIEFSLSPSAGIIVPYISSQKEEEAPAAIVERKNADKFKEKHSRSKSSKRFSGPNKQPSSPPLPSPFPDELVSNECESEDEIFTTFPALEFVKKRRPGKRNVKAHLIGEQIPPAKARKQWPHRYDNKAKQESDSPQCAEHYNEAAIDGEVYRVGDCVAIQGEGSEFIGKVVEFFRTVNNENWFRVQWFFRMGDTAVGELKAANIDPKRIFLSNDEDDNNIECIISKVTVSYISLSDNFYKKGIKLSCDYYYDSCYSTDLSTFCKLPLENEKTSDGGPSSNTDGPETSTEPCFKSNVIVCAEPPKPQMTLLDLYSGCGGMSTGLSMGAALGGVNLVTKWALDLNHYACDSLKHNHPETEVRNEDAEGFLLLLKEWQKLCTKFEGDVSDEELGSDHSSDDGSEDEDEYEVEKVVDIRMAAINRPKKTDSSSTMTTTAIKRQLEYKIRWKGYTSDRDTWEPVENLESCQQRIRDFVIEGRKKRILPLPGQVDVVCGGPPCQGASGFNRYRNTESPLECPRNRQIIVYMDIVEFLRPKFVLMENVVDILKFCEGILGRYALFRLVDMHYQAKLGLMAAGCYGLPQFRMRVFLWGAAPSEILPAFPLPTHDAKYRGVVPSLFSGNVIRQDEEPELERAQLLEDAISDLPPVDNYESRDEVKYVSQPQTPFQIYIRSSKDVHYGRRSKRITNRVLYDHIPLTLNNDDYQRTCRIPKRKGANFRDLGGLKITEDNAVTLDLDVPREYLPSKKPLVPDYAIKFIKGKSLKPFARLWWDDTVPTVVTRAEPHNQQILHPLQDRVLTVRENARLQGFPDWYKLCGPVKERYIQVGNAVAVPVARALGYSLALAAQRLYDEPRVQLPSGFPFI